MSRYKHNFNKAMKTYIETDFYNEAAKYMTNVTPSIVAGPPVRRTRDIALRTVALNHRVNIVEHNRETHIQQREAVGHLIGTKMTLGSISDETNMSRFIDADLTSTIKCQDIYNTLKRQSTKYPSQHKSLIFTYSMRGVNKETTIKYIQQALLKNILDTNSTVTPEGSIIDDDVYELWRREAGYRRPMYCRKFSLITPSSSRVSKCNLYSYNTGDTPMITGIIHYT